GAHQPSARKSRIIPVGMTNWTLGAHRSVIPTTGGAGRVLARFGWFGFVRVEATLFAAPDTAVSPKAFENEFGCGGDGGSILCVGHTEPVDVRDQVFNVGELLVAVFGGGKVGEFELAAKFEPLNDRLEINVAEMF